MPENINNSPARFEENEQYLRDPLASNAKPYSTKQVEANYNHARKVWMYHKTEGAKLFDKSAIKDAEKDGWVDAPFTHPNNPKHQFEEVIESPEMDALRSEAEALGIKVDKRWGLKKLKDELIRVSDG